MLPLIDIVIVYNIIIIITIIIVQKFISNESDKLYQLNL